MARLHEVSVIDRAERDRAWRFEALYGGAVLQAPWARDRLPGAKDRARLGEALAKLGSDAGLVVDVCAFDRLPDVGELERLRTALRRL